MIIKQSISLIFVILGTLHLVESRPEKPNCDWVPEREVILMRDLSDCSKFYYCVKGKTPLSAGCPNSRNYDLYFEPKSNHCVQKWKAPKDCFSRDSASGVGNGILVSRISTTSTPTTTSRAPRPPKLDEKSGFNIDCKLCGLFPNTNGSCDTYIICANGQKQIKSCHGNLKFDVKTRECRPENQANCWKELNAGPHVRKAQKNCPFHGNRASNVIETRKDGVILQNAGVTNWGNWQKWVECPKGTYATGIYAWRRLLVRGPRNDHSGIVSLSFICQTPGGNETKYNIESLAPGLSRDGWPFYYMCKGAVVGIRLNSVKQGGWGRDELATDNVQGLCSCSAPVYKPYEEAKFAPQNGNRGVWTAPQYCKKGQAICGMQTQMHDFRENAVGTYDNTGLNNIRVKCCDVPNPFENCKPKEDLVHIRNCDNSKSDLNLRCDFYAEIGLSIDFNSNQKLIDFYASIGYTIDEIARNVSSKIEKELLAKLKNGDKLLHDWDEITSKEMEIAKETPKMLYVHPFEKLELYQIVGRCGHLFLRTNRYKRVIKDGKSNRIKETNYFEI